jgi:hypothetical protein
MDFVIAFVLAEVVSAQFNVSGAITEHVINGDDK